MPDEEHKEAMKFAIDYVNGRVPVIAGTGSNDTEYCIELSVEAEKMGADALLLVTPYYNKCTQKGLRLHYEKVASKVDLPMILYSVKSRTGVNIAPETLYELSKTENIVAVKEASRRHFAGREDKRPMRRQIRHLFRKRRPDHSDTLARRNRSHLGAVKRYAGVYS